MLRDAWSCPGVNLTDLKNKKKTLQTLSQLWSSGVFITATFFCVTTTAQSVPLMPTEVRPLWVMALKAYSVQHIQHRINTTCSRPQPTFSELTSRPSYLLFNNILKPLIKNRILRKRLLTQKHIVHGTLQLHVSNCFRTFKSNIL